LKNVPSTKGSSRKSEKEGNSSKRGKEGEVPRSIITGKRDVDVEGEEDGIEGDVDGESEGDDIEDNDEEEAQQQESVEGKEGCQELPSLSEQMLTMLPVYYESEGVDKIIAFFSKDRQMDVKITGDNIPDDISLASLEPDPLRHPVDDDVVSVPSLTTGKDIRKMFQENHPDILKMAKSDIKVVLGQMTAQVDKYKRERGVIMMYCFFFDSNGTVWTYLKEAYGVKLTPKCDTVKDEIGRELLKEISSDLDVRKALAEFAVCGTEASRRILTQIGRALNDCKGRNILEIVKRVPERLKECILDRMPIPFIDSEHVTLLFDALRDVVSKQGIVPKDVILYGDLYTENIHSDPGLRWLRKVVQEKLDEGVSGIRAFFPDGGVVNWNKTVKGTSGTGKSVRWRPHERFHSVTRLAVNDKRKCETNIHVEDNVSPVVLELLLCKLHDIFREHSENAKAKGPVIDLSQEESSAGEHESLDGDLDDEQEGLDDDDEEDVEEEDDEGEDNDSGGDDGEGSESEISGSHEASSDEEALSNTDFGDE